MTALTLEDIRELAQQLRVERAIVELGGPRNPVRAAPRLTSPR